MVFSVQPGSVVLQFIGCLAFLCFPRTYRRGALSEPRMAMLTTPGTPSDSGLSTKKTSRLECAAGYNASFYNLNAAVANKPIIA